MEINVKEHFKKNNLLTAGESNAKIGKNILPTYNLSLLPHSLNSAKTNLCTHSTSECRALCLNMSGRGSFHSVQLARELRTEFFIQNKQDFLIVLAAELARINSLFPRVLVRLNTFSDVNWKEEFKYINLDIESFSNITFYNYTKVPEYVINRAKNEEYVFSYSGKNWAQCKTFLDEKLCNVAMVFSPAVPAIFEGYEVIPGDETDQRLVELEGTGKIVGLRFKKPKGIDYQSLNFVVRC